MPKVNVYLPDELAEAVRAAQVPVSAVCQKALERAVRDVTSARGSDAPPEADGPARGLFARFTPRARQALTRAEEIARSVPHDHVGTEHVLLGILADDQNLAVKVLHAIEIEPDDVAAETEASLPPATAAVEGHIPFDAHAKRALEATAREALGLGHNYVGCEHLLLGLIATKGGLAAKVLQRMGAELRTTRRAVTTALSGVVHAKQEQTSRDDATRAALDAILRRLDTIEARLDT